MKYNVYGCVDVDNLEGFDNLEEACERAIGVKPASVNTDIITEIRAYQ